MKELGTTTKDGKICLLFGAPQRDGGRPAIFLDRDGLINQRRYGGYIRNWEEFEFLPGIKAVLQQLSTLGLPMIVVSNQAGVGKGIVERGELDRMTVGFVEALREAGARIDAVYYCPHLVETNCDCRKPRSGLLEQAARDWGIDLPRSVVVGDSLTDVEAARNAHCRAVLLSEEDDSAGQATDDGRDPAVMVVSEVSQIVRSVSQALGLRTRGVAAE